MSDNGVGPLEFVEPGLSYSPNPAIPQCGCQCHNREVANVLAEVDVDGYFMPADHPGEADFWRASPRFVDRRDEAEATLACASCRPLHALAFSSDPAAAWAHEQQRPIAKPEPHEPKLGGPQGRCLPNCPFCRNLDSIKDDHKS